VHYIGYLSRDDLPALYAQCEVFIFPSLAEGFGMPVLEAMASGAPVVTSEAVPLPGLSDVALLCDPRDVHSIANQIVRLLQDDALRVKLSSAGAAYARPFTWRRTAEMTLGVYEEAIQEQL
jgi:glycosyltransferase involved in cell wall biosynthesis